MRKLLITVVLLLLFPLAFYALNRTKKTVHLPVFQQTPILFNPTDYPDGLVEKEGLIYLGNGRIVLKKVRVPHFKNYTIFPYKCQEKSFDKTRHLLTLSNIYHIHF